MTAVAMSAGRRDPLTDRTILLISPSGWGTMRISKHHYAVALARRANRVYFLGPPEPELKDRFQIDAITEVPGLFVIRHRPWAPFWLRFHAPRVYRSVAGRYARGMSRRVGRPFDLVWSFETNLYPDLRRFGAARVVYHVVDQVESRTQIEVARSSDYVLAVAPEILARFDSISAPRFLVDHGLASSFVEAAQEHAEDAAWARGERIRIGYAGNLLRRQIDRRGLRAVIARHQDAEFHFWGPTTDRESNLDGDTAGETIAFIEFLRRTPNVVLRGVAPPSVIAREMQAMDLFLACYDIRQDASGGANSHKLLEYLSTGCPVVTHRVSAYRDMPHLLSMATTDDNSDFCQVFDETVRNLDELQTIERRKTRREYALHHDYARQLDRIAARMADDGW